MAAFQCATSPVSEPVGACAERKERYKPGSQTQLFVWRSLAGNIMGRIVDIREDEEETTANWSECMHAFLRDSNYSVLVNCYVKM